VLIGHVQPQPGEQMKPLGDAFSKMIKVIIARSIFCTVAHGIASMQDMRTNMVTAMPNDVWQAKILPQIPIARLDKPEEVARLIIYLCSKEDLFVLRGGGLCYRRHYRHQRRPAH
jgi:hypothetical protein